VTHRTPALVALVAALSLIAPWASAQETGGRIGGSNWGAAPSVPAPPAPVIAPPAPMIAPPAPVIAPSAPMIAPPAPMIAPPAPVIEPPAPAQRVQVHEWQRGAASPGTPVGDAQERVATEAERAAASPSWSSGYESGPLRWGYGAVAGLLVFGVGLALTLAATRRRPDSVVPVGGAYPPGPTKVPSVRPSPHPGVELRQISVAFDWTARAQIQQQLEALSARVDPSTPPGLHAVAIAARDILSGAHRAARYGMFQSVARPAATAQRAFAPLADRARGRYTVETVNNAMRVLHAASVPRAHEGDGLVVVSLLVAANGPLPQLPATMDVPSLMNALHESVPPRADRLCALEVVWSPASEADRMSSAELTVLYPELLALDPTAALGRRVCAHCQAIYARELGRCPACGAA
jgi:uncharacterized membrane protein